MKERPIIFSAPMIRAILEGQKTQTRRVVKPQPSVNAKHLGWVVDSTDEKDVGCAKFGTEMLDQGAQNIKCPYGQPGDLLWVREAFTDAIIIGGNQIEKTTRYKATDDVTPAEKWKPSIHMPKWAARIWLEVTGIRVERVQKISTNDCVSEGIRQLKGYDEPAFQDYRGEDYMTYNARKSFKTLWDSINGKKPGCSWGDNPWVWVVEFEKLNREWK